MRQAFAKVVLILKFLSYVQTTWWLASGLFAAILLAVVALGWAGSGLLALALLIFVATVLAAILWWKTLPLAQRRSLRPETNLLDLCPPDARPKRYGVAQEGDQPPRIGYETFNRGWRTVKIGSRLRQRKLYVFEPLERVITADDLPVTLTHPDHNDRAILIVHRFIDGGIALQEKSRCVTVRFWMYFGDEDWEPPR